MPPADRRPRLQQATRCTPRSATAQAKVACQLISLDEKQFQSALRQKALANGLGDSARVRYPGGKAILAQGQAGALMYVVLEGRVAISLHGEVVERVGPGGDWSWWTSRCFGVSLLGAMAERLRQVAAAVN